jgi:hypothetical protein
VEEPTASGAAVDEAVGDATLENDGELCCLAEEVLESLLFDLLGDARSEHSLLRRVGGPSLES